MAKEPHLPRRELFAQTVTDIRRLNAWEEACQTERNDAVIASKKKAKA